MKTKQRILSLGLAAALVGTLALPAPKAQAGGHEVGAIIAGALIGGTLGYIASDRDCHRSRVAVSVGYTAPVIVSQPVVYQQSPVIVSQPVVYQQPPVIVSQPVVYQQPTVVYQQPTVVVPAPVYYSPVVVTSPVYPVYRPSVTVSYGFHGGYYSGHGGGSGHHRRDCR